MKAVITLLLFVIQSHLLIAQCQSDAILGKWIPYPRQNFIVEIYKDSNQYKGRLVWFKDTDDTTKPMAVRLDEKNPKPELRHRKLLGIEVLSGMVFNPKTLRWEDGEIYDAKNGRIWSSTARLTKAGTLEVRGFWHFEFIGQSVIFKKV